jgi:MHS family proline/betaine transporter-like MFS transporter
MASWQWASQGLTALVASAFGIALSSLLAPDELLSWGWRIPFFFGLLIGPVGLYIRSRMAETPEFAATEPDKMPIATLLARHPGAVLIAIGASVISNSSNYLILYIPTYAVSELHLPASTGYIATFVGAIILGTVALLAGHWSDKIGRTRIMLAMTILFFVTAYPVFAMMVTHPSLATAIFAAGWLSFVKAGYSGVLPSFLSELFPVETRAIGMSFSYSVSVTIFGGSALYISTLLIGQTGDKLAPSYYLMTTAILSMIAVIAAGRRFAQKPA